jgi:hypothetical protein
MKSAVLASVMMLSVFAGLNSLREPAAAPAPVVLPCVALSGVDSHVGEKIYLRITNLKDWVKLWRKHKGNKSEGDYDFHYDPLGLPTVDFEQYMVIALFEEPDDCTDGFQAESISESAEKITIRFQVKGHQIGFARPFPNNPADGVDEGDDPEPEPVQKAYGFFFVPKSKKAIVMKQQVRDFEPFEVFQFPALK